MLTFPRALRCALFAVLLPFCSSCATLINQGPEQIAVDSNPKGATIYLDDAAIGTTPSFVTLKRKGCDGKIRLELEGYHPARFEIRSEQNWTGLLNVPFGLVGLAGILIDAMADSNWNWYEDALRCELTPLDQPFDPKPVRWPIPKPRPELETDPDPYDI